MLALVTDMTDRHHAETELRASAKRLRNVIDSMSSFVAVLAPDGTLEEANRGPIDAAGLAREDVLGKKFWDCPWWSYDPAVRTRLRAAFDRAVRGEVVRYDETVWFGDDERLVIDFMLQPVFEGERVQFVVPSGVDITVRKRAEEALRISDRRKDEFLATLAHELRNPLAPLRTGLEVMKQSSDRPTRERARQVMERQLGHLVRLVDDLLDICRISQGKIALKREHVPLDVVVDHAVETSRSFIEEGKHELTVHLPNEPVWIDGDLTRLAQVLTNLLDNAAKYTPTGGRIDVEVSVESDQAVIRVQDSGVGVPADTLPRIFDLFAQATHGLGRTGGGLGIGLALVRRLLELHGGTITAESPGLGQGSTFTIRLPVAKVARNERQATTTIGAECPRAAGARRHVLVVDDNEDAAELLATVLDLGGYDTRTAHDGAERSCDGKDVFARGGVPRYRSARNERLRGGSTVQDGSRAHSDRSDRPHGLGSGGGPAAHQGSRVRPPPHQARRSRRRRRRARAPEELRSRSSSVDERCYPLLEVVGADGACV